MPAPTRPNLNLSSEHLFDALVVGAGPAGLSAALSLSRVRRTAVVFTSSQYRNEKAHMAHTILSRDHQPASEIRGIGRQQIEEYGTTQFVERAVLKARKDEKNNVFEVEDANGETWRGKRVMLATGVKDVMPDIEGYADCWGSDIWQCLFCDGMERSDRDGGMLGFSGPMDLHNIWIMFHIGCPSVTIFTNGPMEKPKVEATAHALEIAKAKGVTVDERVIKKLIHLDNDKGIDIIFEDGSQSHVGFLSDHPGAELVAPNLAKDLGVEILPDGKGSSILKRSEPLGETNVKGVFTAGDAGGVMKHFTVAMAQGGLAGAGMNFSLCAEEEQEISRKIKVPN